MPYTLGKLMVKLKILVQKSVPLDSTTQKASLIKSEQRIGYQVGNTTASDLSQMITTGHVSLLSGHSHN